MFLLCLLVVACTSQSVSCPAYVCSSISTTTGVCVEAKNATYYYQVTPCASGYYCPTSQQPVGAVSCMANPTPVPLPPKILFAGQKSSNKTLCWSDTISGDYCTGVAAGGMCTSNNDCNAGLYCNATVNGTCLATVAYGGNCSMTGAFINNGCKRGSTCVMGTCIKDYSLNVGATLQSCASHNFNNLCASGACVEMNNGTTISYQCITAPTSAMSIPSACNATTLCLSSKVTQTGSPLTGTCMCGTNMKGNQYCTLWPGDSYPMKNKNSMTSWMGSSNYDSCAMVVSDMTCAKDRWSSSSYANWVYYNYMASEQILMANAPSCVVKVFYAEYAAIQKAYSSGAWILAVPFIVLSILV